MDKKTIYLTFDDGIQEGTSCVLDVLGALDIKATFFLAGINSQHYYETNGRLFADSLARIIQHHEAGNHSFSHCNGLYKEYYTKGILAGTDGTGISVADDFTKNDVFFRKMFAQAGLPCEPGKRLFHIARLPGRNSWLYTLPDTARATDSDAANGKLKLIVDCEEDSYPASISLFSKGYQIIGWHEEWRMRFELHEEAMAARRQQLVSGENTRGGFTYYFPYHDISNAANIMKDRLVEDHEAVFRRIQLNPQKHIVLLMHDRAFRNGHGAPAAADMLYDLLAMMKQHGFSFGTISNFLNR